MTDTLRQLKVKLFADGAELAGISSLYANPLIQGITTNPTLMRKAGIDDYEEFAKSVLLIVKDKPISFEVFSDDFSEMRRQAMTISNWNENVYVKIPVMNTQAQSSLELIRDLADEGVKLNVTAVLTLEQVDSIVKHLNSEVPAIISIFAGRIADTGRDPMPVMKSACAMAKGLPLTEILWASVREVLNIFQAEACGCDIITVPHDILSKALQLCGKDLSDLSLDTVKMFYGDACKANFSLR